MGYKMSGYMHKKGQTRARPREKDQGRQETPGTDTGQTGQTRGTQVTLETDTDRSHSFHQRQIRGADRSGRE
jgi:hypothetical protein